MGAIRGRINMLIAPAFVCQFDAMAHQLLDYRTAFGHNAATSSKTSRRWRSWLSIPNMPQRNPGP
jgi:hypothetical protein